MLFVAIDLSLGGKVNKNTPVSRGALCPKCSQSNPPNIWAVQLQFQRTHPSGFSGQCAARSACIGGARGANLVDNPCSDRGRASNVPSV